MRLYNDITELPFEKWHKAKMYINQIALGSNVTDIRNCLSVALAYETQGDKDSALQLYKGIFEEIINPEKLPYVELYHTLLIEDVPLSEVQKLPMKTILEAINQLQLLSG
jgi:hypothetical protein